MNSKTFSIPVSYTFEGYFEIKARDIREAREIALNNCGMTADSGVHTSDERVMDWSFPTHPEKELVIKNV